MKSPLYSNTNKEGSSYLSFALLLALLAFPCSGYALDESKKDAISLNETDSSAYSREKTEKTFNLNDKKSSRLMLLKRLYANSPENPVIATKLAMTYVQMARNQSDPSYYALAREAIKPWQRQPNIPGLATKEPPVAIRLIRATLAQHDHHYADARDDLLKLIKQQPYNTQAWITLSIIHLVQGDYKKAEVSCSALARIASKGLASLCYSQLYSLTGSAKKAYRMQQKLLMNISNKQTEERLWIIGLMAETAMRRGNDQQAEKHFQQGMKIKPNDIYILRTYSDFLLDKQRYKDVIPLLAPFLDNDQLLLRFVIANKRSKNKITQWLTVLKQRFANTLLKNNHIHGRDEALFLLEFNDDKTDNKKRALQLAEKNWDVQKEPDDALILLRAAIANQQTEKAQIIFDWIEKNKLQDQRIEKLRSSL
jgi:tetratricopeptide (TPR) repeat protein